MEGGGIDGGVERGGWRRRVAAVVWAAGLTAGIVASLGAVPVYGMETEEQLARIKAEVEEASTRLTDLNRQQTEREGALKRLRQELGALRADEKRLTGRLDAVRRERAEIDAELGRLGAEMSRLEGLTARRMRALYMYQGRAVTEHVLGAESSGDLLKNAFLLSKVTAFDRALLAEVRALVVQQEAALSDLVRVTGEQERLRGELATQAEAVKGKLKEQERLVARAAAEATAVEEVLAGLRAQALRLETVLLSLIDSGDGGSRGAAPERAVARRAAPVGPFGGAGLEPPRKRLPAPVAGRLVAPFGRRKPTRFEDYVLTKGHEYGAPPGSPVKAVAAGRVLHTGPLPGYGTIVVLDHGSRSYSLYGRIVGITVTPGTDVGPGDRLGETGAPGESGGEGNLYFEIRRGGTAVDPAPYLR